MTKKIFHALDNLPLSTVEKLVFHDRDSRVGNKLNYTFNKIE